MLSPAKPHNNRSAGLAFFSRGRGRGHAVPDLAIAHEIASLAPTLDIHLISYADGADALRAFSSDVLDLRLPRDPPFFDLLVRQTQVIDELRPALIVAHEEFAVPPVATAFNIRCLFITDCFLDPGSLPMNALRYACEVLFTAERGLYTEPPFLRGKIHYLGPAIRRFEYSLRDRTRARQELHLPLDAVVVLCQPGGWSEAQISVADNFIAAWDSLPYPTKHLIWVAGSDFEQIRMRFDQRPDVLVLKEDLTIDRLIVASNLVITKANRLTVYEVASLGVPSLSISAGANWPDDVAVSSVASNTVIDLESLTPGSLAESICRLVETVPPQSGSYLRSDGLMQAARRVVEWLHLIEQSTNDSTSPIVSNESTSSA
jgi:UDP-N-acetylglucosamine:LPS N-acetylglucosamine transferase